MRTLSFETLVSADDTNVARVGNEVVKRAFVTVLTGKESVGAVAVKTSTELPAGTVVAPLAKGLSPGTMSTGPVSAKIAVGLPTWVH